MNKIFIFYAFTILIVSACKTNNDTSGGASNLLEETLEDKKTITRIAFGSCNNQSKPQPLWQEIINQQPDLWVWLGDNIYGDTQDMDVMQRKYDTQKSVPGYQKLMSAVPIIGIWDDHDYGINNGGRFYAKKEESKKLMLEFLNEPDESGRWDHPGAFTSYELGAGDHQVKLILLDTRYFRDTVISDKSLPLGNQLNENGNILGSAQWEWLEHELNTSEAKINIIASSIQVIPEEHLYEKWANFPNERKKLFGLIAASQAEGVILISGDRHMAEISKMTLENMDYPFYDFTSSGLTHTWGSDRPEKNKHRVGNKVVALNYGLITIEWMDKGVKVSFSIMGKNNKQFLKETVLY